MVCKVSPGVSDLVSTTPKNPKVLLVFDLLSLPFINVFCSIEWQEHKADVNLPLTKEL